MMKAPTMKQKKYDRGHLQECVRASKPAQTESKISPKDSLTSVVKDNIMEITPLMQEEIVDQCSENDMV